MLRFPVACFVLCLTLLGFELLRFAWLYLTLFGCALLLCALFYEPESVWPLLLALAAGSAADRLKGFPTCVRKMVPQPQTPPRHRTLLLLAWIRFSYVSGIRCERNFFHFILSRRLNDLPPHPYIPLKDEAALPQRPRGRGDQIPPVCAAAPRLQAGLQKGVAPTRPRAGRRVAADNLQPVRTKLGRL